MNLNYKNALENLSLEYKKILASNEYTTGKKVLKFKFYLKHLKFIKLFNKVLNSKKHNLVYVKDNFNNEKLFYDNVSNQIGNKIKESKIVVYTVNIGGYDNLIQPLYKDNNVDFIIVSDKKPANLGKWKWLDANNFVKDMDLSNVKKARFIKTHPHIIFPNYDYSIFIDGNICCVSDITDFISNINKGTRIAIHPHPYRDCVYKELKACKITKKGNYSIMKKQVDEYRKLGFPKEFGLFETNVFIREHNNKTCIKIMEDWWNEINNKSERDQISFTYVLWKNGFKANDIGVIYNSILNNPKVLVVNHIEDYEK